MEFTEDLLHYFWKSGLYRSSQLHTTSGESLNIIAPGLHNTNSGPDFEQALIRIADTLWAGNVEMHLRSSDWYKHAHQHDTAYDNVILHVVYEHDKTVFRQDGTQIPVLELKNKIPERLIFSYRDLINSQHWIACEKALPSVDPLYIHSWLNRVLIERLEQKSTQIINLVKELRGNWDDAFYITIARSFGFKHNALPFECLAKSLNQQILAWHKQQALQIEALIFGQSGLLAKNFEDEYPQKLKQEFNFLAKKYRLKPLDASIWKFMRLRPANFPSIRLAQFAALVLKSNHLFAHILDTDDVLELKNNFAQLPINTYWQTHYRFDKLSAKHQEQLGELSLNNLMINSVATFLFAYGLYHNLETYRLRALQLLEQVPAENNQLLKRFEQLGLSVNTASSSQGLLQLKNNYCDLKKCLHCSIGSKILTKSALC